MDARRFQSMRAGFGYPDVPPSFGVDWESVDEDYSPVEYTAASVKQAVPYWESVDIEAVWVRAKRLSIMGEALMRDCVTGRPLNPNGPTGISGHGRLRTFGPNLSADGVVIHGDEVLLIERKDTGQLAFPGGYRNYHMQADKYEDPVDAAIREVHEETSLALSGVATVIARGVPYFVTRNTDNAWIEDSAVLIDVSDTLKRDLRPVAGDDARKGSARWVPIEQVDTDKMSPRHAEHIYQLRGGMIGG